MDTQLTFDQAPEVVKRGGHFRVRDLLHVTQYDYCVTLGVACFVVTATVYGREHYIGSASYKDVTRFRHAGAKSGFARTHAVVRTFDRMWRRYLHPVPPFPDIRSEIAIHALDPEGF